jgi:hypothetical protein
VVVVGVAFTTEVVGAATGEVDAVVVHPAARSSPSSRDAVRRTVSAAMRPG